MKNNRNPRRNNPVIERAKAYKLELPTILIVCEGENTEPSYFNQFKLKTATIKTIGEGYNTTSLVERTKEIAKEKEYDQVWCVFDKDDFSVNNFNNAIIMAQKLGIKVAYSNQAFEYWIILHLEDHQGGGINRNLYNKKINDLLKSYKIKYDGNKSKKITKELFDLLDGYDKKSGEYRKILAIKRAKRNLKNIDQKNPAKEESSTTVYKLVEEILKYI